LALEMMQETRHAPLAFAAARTVGLPVWLGVSCRVGAGGALVGFDFPLVPLAATLDALLPFAPDAIAVMHSPIAAVAPALHEIRARWHGLLGAYPEIGNGSAATQAVAPAALGAQARDWVDAGARIVGGCCGTHPEHIRALAASLKATGSARPPSARDSRAARRGAPRS
jgi:S-methylmethionine-dependent homocysteine/selenocysteine methylase